MIDDKSIVVMKLILVMTLISMIGMSGIVMVIVADSFTVKQTGTESVSCIDKQGNKFQDEICWEKVYCSKLGIAAGEKCSKEAQK